MISVSQHSNISSQMQWVNKGVFQSRAAEITERNGFSHLPRNQGYFYVLQSFFLLEVRDWLSLNMDEDILIYVFPTKLWKKNK